MKYRYSKHYRCTCRAPDGKLLGSSKTSGCPKLWRKDGSWNAKHGSAGIVMRVPTSTGTRTLKRSGCKSTADAEAAGDQVCALLALAPDDITARKIGDMVMSVKRGAELPPVEDVRRRLALRKSPDQQSMTTGEFLNGVFLPSKRLAKRPSTARGYEIHARKYLVPELGHIQLDRLDFEHIQEMIAKVPGSAASQHRVMATLKSALSMAVRQHKLQYNPAVGIELEPEVTPEAQRWTPAQARQFIEKTAGDPMGLMLRVAVLKGVRRGELVGLRWENWDAKERSFTLSSTLLQLSGRLTDGTPKTRAGVRTIYLGPETARLIEAYREQQLFDAQVAGLPNPELVFCKTDGSPWKPDHVSKRFRKLCTRAGVPSVKLHEGGRHTGRSLMGDVGVAEDVSMREVGHSDRATHSRYNHPLVTAHQQAAQDVENLVFEAGDQA